MFRRFWERQTTSSTPSQHQTSLESPFNDNTATSSATSPFLNALTRKLVFYMSAVFISAIAAVFSPVLLLLPLISLPIIRLLMSITDGEAYTNLTQVKLFILNFTFYYLLFFISPVNFLSHLFASSELLISVTLLGLPLDLWRHITMLMFYMFSTSFHLSALVQFFPPVLIPLDLTESNLHVSEALLEIANCVLIFYLNVESYRDGKRFPLCKTHEILGFHTWKWIEALIFVVVIHNIIALFTHLIVWVLRKLVYECRASANSPWYVTLLFNNIRKEIVYWVNGVKYTMNCILTLTVILLTWVLYFRSHLNATPEAKRVFEFGTWTFLNLLIFTFLWLIKTCVIMSWESRSIYSRLHSKILQIGPKLYFLGIIGSQYEYDIFNLMIDHSLARDKYLDYLWILQPLFQSDSRRQKRLREYLSKGRMNRAKDYLLMQETRNPSIYGVRQAALHFLMAQDKLLDNKFTSNILHNFKDCGLAQDDKNGIRRKVNFVDIKLLELIGVDGYNDFKSQLRDEGYMDNSFDLIFYKQFETWMERAHNKCIWLANTLSNAKDVTNCLDKMLSWLLSIMSFAMWLRLTGLATTQDLFVIASLFIIAAVVFRDACNILVKGIIFVYAMHPFDVGDLCVIDEQMMEVRTIDIWKTSFLTIDAHEEVIYSNSYLFDRYILNFKTDFDWSASIMLEASSLDAGNIKDLKQKIEEHLNKKDRFIADYNNHVEVVTVGDNIKMVVKFKLNGNNLKNSTYAECFKEKCRLRSEFILYAQSLMDQIKLKGSPFSEKFVDNGQEKRDDAASSSAAAAISKSKS